MVVVVVVMMMMMMMTKTIRKRNADDMQSKGRAEEVIWKEQK
jgi:uncharacterized membrane protein